MTPAERQRSSRKRRSEGRTGLYIYVQDLGRVIDVMVDRNLLKPEDAEDMGAVAAAIAQLLEQQKFRNSVTRDGLESEKGIMIRGIKSTSQKQ